jgi:succinate-acetate transporter protein
MKKIFQNLTKGEIRNTIALSMVFLSFSFLFALLFVEIPKENENMINIVAGAVLVSGLAQIVGFYFGSSKSEQDSKQQAADNQNPVS